MCKARISGRQSITSPRADRFARARSSRCDRRVGVARAAARATARERAARGARWTRRDASRRRRRLADVARVVALVGTLGASAAERFEARAPDDGVASAVASAVALVAGAAGMAMSLERETDAREAALADKVRAQADAMADAAWEKIEASEASAEAVRRDVAARGVARVNGVMREDTARAMEAYVRETLRTNDAGGDGRNLSVESFGNVYCKKNRWDLKLAYDAPVRAALRECVASMGEALTAVCGADAKLVELAALVSDPGSTRQPVHPDTAYRRDPSVFTCFVALQDVERDMGPTLFIPGTNNAQAHVEFREGNEREGPVFRRPYELGVISRGDATLFDSRTLHCGTENDSSRRRVLFYFSFQRADGDNPNAAISTIRTELRDKYTLADLLP